MMDRALTQGRGLFSWNSPARRFWTRSVAVSIIFSFTLPYLTWAFESANYLGTQAVMIRHAGKALVIPAQLGSVSAGEQAGERLIVHIQDLHCNYEVQKNISGIIGYLAREHGVRLVGEEGAYDTVNVAKFSTFPMASVRDEVSDYLVRQGKLSGAEYYQATGGLPVRLEGLETPAVYEENYRLIGTFLNNESQGYCEDLHSALDDCKAGVYSPDLLRFDAQRAAYRQGNLELLRYAVFLAGQARRAKMDTARYSNLEKFVAGQNALLPQGLDADALYRELDDLDAALRRGLYRNPQEMWLDELIRRLDVIERLINISATPADVADFRARRAVYSVEPFLEFIRQHDAADGDSLDAELLRLNRHLDAVARFYQLADVRSREFVDNLLAKMDRYGQKTSVMLTGGYHTQEILAELKQRNITCLTVTPRLTRQDLVNPYFALLQNRRSPIEKLLAKNQNIMALRTACADGLFAPDAVVRNSQLERPEQRLLAELGETLMGHAALVSLRRQGQGFRAMMESARELGRRYPANELFARMLEEPIAAENEALAGSRGPAPCLLLPTTITTAQGKVKTIAWLEPVEGRPTAAGTSVDTITLGGTVYSYYTPENVPAALETLLRSQRRVFVWLPRGLSLAAYFGYLGPVVSALARTVEPLSAASRQPGTVRGWAVVTGRFSAAAAQDLIAGLMAQARAGWSQADLLRLLGTTTAISGLLIAGSMGVISAGPGLVMTGLFLVAASFLPGANRLIMETVQAAPRLGSVRPEDRKNAGRLFFGGPGSGGYSSGGGASGARGGLSLLGNPVVKLLLMVGAALIFTAVAPSFDPLWQLISIILWVAPFTYLGVLVFYRFNTPIILNLVLASLTTVGLIVGYFAYLQSWEVKPPEPARVHQIGEQALQDLKDKARAFDDQETLYVLERIKLVWSHQGLPSDGAFTPGIGVASIPGYEITLPDYADESSLPVAYADPENMRLFFEYLIIRRGPVGRQALALSERQGETSTYVAAGGKAKSEALLGQYRRYLGFFPYVYEMYVWKSSDDESFRQEEIRVNGIAYYEMKNDKATRPELRPLYQAGEIAGVALPKMENGRVYTAQSFADEFYIEVEEAMGGLDSWAQTHPEAVAQTVLPGDLKAYFNPGLYAQIMIPRLLEVETAGNQMVQELYAARVDWAKENRPDLFHPPLVQVQANAGVTCALSIYNRRTRIITIVVPDEASLNHLQADGNAVLRQLVLNQFGPTGSRTSIIADTGGLSLEQPVTDPLLAYHADFNHTQYPLANSETFNRTVDQALDYLHDNDAQYFFNRTKYIWNFVELRIGREPYVDPLTGIAYLPSNLTVEQAVKLLGEFARQVEAVEKNPTRAPDLYQQPPQIPLSRIPAMEAPVAVLPAGNGTQGADQTEQGARLTQPATAALNDARVAGLAARLVRGLGALGVAVVEEFGLGTSDANIRNYHLAGGLKYLRTMREAFVQGRVPAALFAVALYLLPLFTAVNPLLLAALVVMAFVAVGWFQIEFVAGHENTVRAQWLARLRGTLLLNAVAVGVTLLAASLAVSLLSGPLLAAAVLAAPVLGVLASTGAHWVWNRVMPAKFKLEQGTLAEESPWAPVNGPPRALASLTDRDWNRLLAPDRPGQTVVVMATRNRQKKAAWREFFRDDPWIKWVALDEQIADLPEPPEIGRTYADNAAAKAKQIRGVIPAGWQDRVYVLAEDSGLEVDALTGEPGIHTRRYAAGEPDFALEYDQSPALAAVAKIMARVRGLATQAPRGIQAAGATALIGPDGRTRIDNARLRGRLPREARLPDGVWDPLHALLEFESGLTYPEMSPAQRAENPGLSDRLLRAVRAALTNDRAAAETAAQPLESDRRLAEFDAAMQDCARVIDGAVVGAFADRNDLVRDELDFPGSFALSRLVGYGEAAQVKFNALRGLLGDPGLMAWVRDQPAYRPEEFVRRLADRPQTETLAGMFRGAEDYAALRELLADAGLLGRIAGLAAVPWTVQVSEGRIWLRSPATGETTLAGYFIPLANERKTIFHVLLPVSLAAQMDWHAGLLGEASRILAGRGWTLLEAGTPEAARLQVQPSVLRDLYLDEIEMLGGRVRLRPTDAFENPDRLSYEVVIGGRHAGTVVLVRSSSGEWRRDAMHQAGDPRVEWEAWSQIERWAAGIERQSRLESLESVARPETPKAARPETAAPAPNTEFQQRVGEALLVRAAALAREGHWFYYYGDFFLTDAVLDFIGYGEAVSFADESERSVRRAYAERVLDDMEKSPEVQAAFLEHLAGYRVQITDRDRNSPLFLAAANFLAGRNLEDTALIHEWPALALDTYLAAHTWYGTDRLARQRSPVIALPHAPRRAIRVLVIGGAEKFGRNQKALYLRDMIRQAVGPDVPIEIEVTDISYQETVWAYDETTGRFTRRPAFAFGTDGTYRDPATGVVFRKIDLDAPDQDIAAAAGTYDASAKFDAVINARVAVQYFRDPAALANILANSQRHLAENGLLLYDTADTDRVEMYLNLPGRGVEYAGALPFREQVVKDLETLFQTLGFRSGLVENAYRAAVKYSDEKEQRVTPRRVLANLLAEAVKDPQYLAAVLLRGIAPSRYRALIAGPDQAAILYEQNFNLAQAPMDPAAILQAAYDSDGAKNLAFWKLAVGRYGALPPQAPFATSTQLYRDERGEIAAGTVAGHAAFRIRDRVSGRTVFLVDESGGRIAGAWSVPPLRRLETENLAKPGANGWAAGLVRRLGAWGVALVEEFGLGSTPAQVAAYAAADPGQRLLGIPEAFVQGRLASSLAALGLFLVPFVVAVNPVAYAVFVTLALAGVGYAQIEFAAGHDNRTREQWLARLRATLLFNGIAIGVALLAAGAALAWLSGPLLIIAVLAAPLLGTGASTLAHRIWNYFAPESTQMTQGGNRRRHGARNAAGSSNDLASIATLAAVQPLAARRQLTAWLREHRKAQAELWTDEDQRTGLLRSLNALSDARRLTPALSAWLQGLERQESLEEIRARLLNLEVLQALSTRELAQYGPDDFSALGRGTWLGQTTVRGDWDAGTAMLAGRYRVTESIKNPGFFSFGVFRARDLKTGENVILKLSKPSEQGSLAELKEAAIYGELDGEPSVVTLLDSGWFEDTRDRLPVFFLVMEDAGRNLKSIVYAKRTFADLLNDVAQLLSAALIALNQVHRRDVVHGDVKEDQFFVPVGEDGRPDWARMRLGDFNLAQRMFGAVEIRHRAAFMQDAYLSDDQSQNIYSHERDLRAAGSGLDHLLEPILSRSGRGSTIRAFLAAWGDRTIRKFGASEEALRALPSYRLPELTFGTRPRASDLVELGVFPSWAGFDAALDRALEEAGARQYRSRYGPEAYERMKQLLTDAVKSWRYTAAPRNWGAGSEVNALLTAAREIQQSGPTGAETLKLQTTAALEDFRIHGTAATLVRRWGEWGVAVVEEFGIGTWGAKQAPVKLRSVGEAFRQGRLFTAVIATALFSIPFLAAVNPLVMAGLVALALMGVGWTQIEFAAGHDNATRRQWLARLRGTLVFNSVAVLAALAVAVGALAGLTGPFLVAGLLLAPLLGAAASTLAHRLWNAVAPADLKMQLQHYFEGESGTSPEAARPAVTGPAALAQLITENAYRYLLEVFRIAGADRSGSRAVYFGAGGDISSALLSTNAAELIFIDRQTRSTRPLTPGQKAHWEVQYLEDKQPTAYGLEDVLNLLGCDNAIRLELEKFGATQISQTVDLDGTGDHFEIQFDWTHPVSGLNEHRTVKVFKADAFHPEVYPDILRRELERAPLDHWILKSITNALFGNLVDEATGGRLAAYYQQRLSPRGVILTNHRMSGGGVPSFLPAGMSRLERGLEKLRSFGAAFGYPSPANPDGIYFYLRSAEIEARAQASLRARTALDRPKESLMSDLRGWQGIRTLAGDEVCLALGLTEGGAVELIETEDGQAPFAQAMGLPSDRRVAVKVVEPSFGYLRVVLWVTTAGQLQAMARQEAVRVAKVDARTAQEYALNVTRLGFHDFESQQQDLVLSWSMAYNERKEDPRWIYIQYVEVGPAFRQRGLANRIFQNLGELLRSRIPGVRVMASAIHPGSARPLMNQFRAEIDWAHMYDQRFDSNWQRVCDALGIPTLGMWTTRDNMPVIFRAAKAERGEGELTDLEFLMRRFEEEARRKNVDVVALFNRYLNLDDDSIPIAARPVAISQGIGLEGYAIDYPAIDTQAGILAAETGLSRSTLRAFLIYLVYPALSESAAIRLANMPPSGLDDARQRFLLPGDAEALETLRQRGSLSLADAAAWVKNRADQRPGRFAAAQPGVGGIMVWLRTLLIRWSGGRLTERVYNERLAWVAENALSLAAGAMIAALALGGLAAITGTVFSAGMLPAAAYLAAWPIFFALHLIPGRNGERTLNANLRRAAWIAALNLLPALVLAVFNVGLLFSPLAVPALILFSLIVHASVNIAGRNTAAEALTPETAVRDVRTVAALSLLAAGIGLLAFLPGLPFAIFAVTALIAPGIFGLPWEGMPVLRGRLRTWTDSGLWQAWAASLSLAAAAGAVGYFGKDVDLRAIPWIAAQPGLHAFVANLVEHWGLNQFAWLQLATSIPFGLILLERITGWRRPDGRGQVSRLVAEIRARGLRGALAAVGGSALSLLMVTIIYPLHDVLHQFIHVVTAAWLMGGRLGGEFYVAVLNTPLTRFLVEHWPSVFRAENIPLDVGIKYYNEPAATLLQAMAIQTAPNILFATLGILSVRAALKRRSLPWLIAAMGWFTWPLSAAFNGDFILKNFFGFPAAYDFLYQRAMVVLNLPLFMLTWLAAFLTAGAILRAFHAWRQRRGAPAKVDGEPAAENTAASQAPAGLEPLKFTPLSPVIHTYPEGSSVAMVVNPDAFQLSGECRWDFDRIRNRPLFDGQEIPFTQTAQLENAKAGLPKMIAAYQAAHPDREVIAALPSGNLGFNPWTVGYASGRIYYKSNEPLSNRVYDMLVAGGDGTWSVRPVKLMNLAGETGIFDPASDRSLAGEIAYGIYGPRIVRNGKPALDQAFAEIEDLRHLLRFPMFNLPGKRQMHLGYSDDLGELLTNPALLADAVAGKPVTLNQRPLAALGITPAERDLTFAQWGYRDRTGSQASADLQPGEYTVDEAAGTLTMAFLPGTHPHSLFGVTRDGKLLTAAVAGQTHYAGSTLRQLAEDLVAQGAQDVFLWANGKDVLLWEQDGLAAAADGVRQTWLETVLITRPKTQAAPAVGQTGASASADFSAREELRAAGQDYLDFLSMDDDLGGRAPDVFLVCGNPDFRSFTEFAARWRELRDRTGAAVPVVLAGGRGRGTQPMLDDLVGYAAGRTDLTGAQRARVADLAARPDVQETQIMSLLFQLEGLPESVLEIEDKTPEGLGSANTAQNFQFARGAVQRVLDRRRDKTAEAVVAMVSWPPLLLRLLASARGIWKNEIANGWKPARFRAYAPTLQEAGDAELIAQMGYLAGYPEKYVAQYPGLNPYNELRGTQRENNPNVESLPLTAAHWSLLDRVRNRLERLLDAYSVRFDPGKRLLVPEQPRTVSDGAEPLGGLMPWLRVAVGRLSGGRISPLAYDRFVAFWLENTLSLAAGYGVATIGAVALAAVTGTAFAFPLAGGWIVSWVLFFGLHWVRLPGVDRAPPRNLWVAGGLMVLSLLLLAIPGLSPAVLILLSLIPHAAVNLLGSFRARAPAIAVRKQFVPAAAARREGALLQTLDLSPYEKAYVYYDRAYIVWTEGPLAGYVARIQERPSATRLQRLPSFRSLQSEVDRRLRAIEALPPRSFAEAGRLRGELRVYLQSQYQGDAAMAGVREAHLFQTDRAYGVWLQEIAGEGAHGWLAARAKTLGLTRTGFEPNSIDGVEMAAMRTFYGEHTPAAPYADFDENPIIMIHKTYDDVLTNILQLRALASKDAFEAQGIHKRSGGETGRADAETPDEVSFWDVFYSQNSAGGHWGSTRIGFEVPIVLGVDQASYERLRRLRLLKNGTMSGETTVADRVPLSEITHLFVPEYAMAETRALLRAHGITRIAVLPLGYEAYNQAKWRGGAQAAPGEADAALAAQDEAGMESALAYAAESTTERENYFTARIGAAVFWHGRELGGDFNHIGNLHAEEWALIQTLRAAIRLADLPAERKVALELRLERVADLSDHPRDAELHRIAIEELQAVDRALGHVLKDMTLYVTMELCNNCVDLLLKLGVKRVVYAHEAVNPNHVRVSDLPPAGIPVRGGLHAVEALAVNRGYILAVTNFPWLYDRLQALARGWNAALERIKSAWNQNDVLQQLWEVPMVPGAVRIFQRSLPLIGAPFARAILPRGVQPSTEQLLSQLLARGSAEWEANDGKRFRTTYAEMAAAGEVHWIKFECFAGGELIGYLHMIINDETQIASVGTAFASKAPAIVIRQDYSEQYRGLGRDLMGLGMALAKLRGCRTFNAIDVWAPTFFRNLGFKPTRSGNVLSPNYAADLTQVEAPSDQVTRRTPAEIKARRSRRDAARVQLIDAAQTAGPRSRTARQDQLSAEEPDAPDLLGLPRGGDRSRDEDTVAGSRLGGLMPWLKAWYVERGLARLVPNADPAESLRQRERAQARLEREYQSRAWLIEALPLAAGGLAALAAALAFGFVSPAMGLTGLMFTAVRLSWFLFPAWHLGPKADGYRSFTREDWINVGLSGVLAAVNIAVSFTPVGLAGMILFGLASHGVLNWSLRALQIRRSPRTSSAGENSGQANPLTAEAQKEIWRATYRRERAQPNIVPEERISSFARQVVSAFKERLAPGSSILTLGAWLGYDEIFFLENGYRVLATDQIEEPLKDLRAEADKKGLGGALEVRTQDLNEPMTFALESQDAVYSHLSLHYMDLESFNRRIAEIRNVIRHGGYLALAVRSLGDPKYLNADRRSGNAIVAPDGRRQWFFSAEILRDALGPEFEIIHASTESVNRYEGQGPSVMEVMIARRKPAPSSGSGQFAGIIGAASPLSLVLGEAAINEPRYRQHPLGEAVYRHRTDVFGGKFAFENILIRLGDSFGVGHEAKPAGAQAALDGELTPGEVGFVIRLPRWLGWTLAPLSSQTPLQRLGTRLVGWIVSNRLADYAAETRRMAAEPDADELALLAEYQGTTRLELSSETLRGYGGRSAAELYRHRESGGRQVAVTSLEVARVLEACRLTVQQGQGASLWSLLETQSLRTLLEDGETPSTATLIQALELLRPADVPDAALRRTVEIMQQGLTAARRDGFGPAAVQQAAEIIIRSRQGLLAGLPLLAPPAAAVEPGGDAVHLLLDAESRAAVQTQLAGWLAGLPGDSPDREPLEFLRRALAQEILTPQDGARLQELLAALALPERAMAAIPVGADVTRFAGSLLNGRAAETPMTVRGVSLVFIQPIVAQVLANSAEAILALNSQAGGESSVTIIPYSGAVPASLEARGAFGSQIGAYLSGPAFAGRLSSRQALAQAYYRWTSERSDYANQRMARVLIRILRYEALKLEAAPDRQAGFAQALEQLNGLFQKSPVFRSREIGRSGPDSYFAPETLTRGGQLGYIGLLRRLPGDFTLIPELERALQREQLRNFRMSSAA